MEVKLRLQYYWENFERIHLRPIRRFYGAYLFNKSSNAIFEILIDCSFWSGDFENQFYFNHSMTTTKDVAKNSTVNYLVAQEQVEKIKINFYHRK